MRFLLKPPIFGPFVEINAARQVRVAVETALASRCAVRITSNPGRGKTFALWHICEQLGGYYCQVASEQKAGRGLWEMLLASAGVIHDCRHAGDMADLVYSRFDCRRESEPMLLVIDEYQNIEPAYQRELLSLQETTQIALVLAGNTVGLRRRSVDVIALEQIDDRIWHNVTVSELSAEDCCSIGVEFNVEGKDAYSAITAFGLGSNARQLVRLLTYAKALTQGQGSVQLRHIESAVLARNGNGSDLALLEAVA